MSPGNVKPPNKRLQRTRLRSPSRKPLGGRFRGSGRGANE